MNLGFGSITSSGSGTSDTGPTINIQRTDDPYARYTMPKPDTRTKLKGQYAETYIFNLPQIARALKVEDKWIAKFFGQDLSSQIRWDQDHWTLKGAFEYDALEESLRLFIDRYVLCHKCELPELDYLVQGKGKRVHLGIKCRGCGTVKSCDPSKDRIHKTILSSLLTPK